MATDRFLDSTGLRHLWEKIKAWIPFLSRKTQSIPFGQVDSTSTSTLFTATVDGIDELRDGVCCYLRNGVVSCASGWTLNINSLGAKPVYDMMYNTSATTSFSASVTMLFIYNSSRIYGGCWDMYLGRTYDLSQNYISVGHIDVGNYPTGEQSLCAFDINGKLTPFVTEATTSTGKTLVSSIFPVGAKIFRDSRARTANSSFNDVTLYTTLNNIDLRYSSVNHNQAIFPNNTFNRVFMIVTVNTQNDTFTLSTQTTSGYNNNFTNERELKPNNFYIEIGFNSASGTSYNAVLLCDNPLYYYNGTNLIEYSIYKSSIIDVPDYKVEKLLTPTSGYRDSYRLEKDGSAIVGSDTINIPTEFTPIVSRTYDDDTFYCSGTANRDNASRCFMAITPEAAQTYWYVKYRVKVWIPADTTYKRYTESIVEFFGSGATMRGYRIWNTLSETTGATNYNLARWLTADGLTNGFPHLIGTDIIYSTNYTNSAWYRYVKVDLLAYEGCKVELLDNLTKFEQYIQSIEADLSTDYGVYSAYIATDNGLSETNDLNDTYTMILPYAHLKAGVNGIKANSLIMQDGKGDWQSFTTDSGTGAAKTKNSSGYRLGSKIYYINNSNNYAAGTVLPSWLSVCAYKQNVDFRYSLNITNTAGGANNLLPYKALYIVGDIGNDGLFYLDNIWWTQDEPSTEDGKIYIRVCESIHNDYENDRCYRGDLMSDGHAYWFRDGAFRRYYGVGHLNTDNTSSLPVSSSESFCEDISLHKIAKTGSYSDLNDKPTIPSSGDFVTSLGTSGDNVTWTKNGVTNNLTVPYATNSGTATKIGTATVGSTTLPVYINSGTPTAITSIPGSLIKGSGINSMVNSASGVGINPAINGAGMNLAKGGSVELIIDDFKFKMSDTNPNYLDKLFDGLNSTCFQLFYPTSAIDVDYHTYSSSNTYSIGDIVIYKNTEDKVRWYRSKTNSNTGNSPTHETDNTYWEYVSGTGNVSYALGLNPQKFSSVSLLITLSNSSLANNESGLSIYWRTAGQHPKYLTVEKYSDANFTTLAGTCCTQQDMTGETVTSVYCGVTASSQGKYFKLIFEGWGNTTNYWACVPTQIAFTGLTGGIEGTVVMRKGGSVSTMFGDFYPNSDSSISLGTSSRYWNNVYANKFIKKGGTSSQFLKADGSVDSNTYATTSQLPSLPLSIANGGTGQTTGVNAANALIGSLPQWTADPSDNVYLIRRDTGGSLSFGQVKFSTVWNYIKSKIASILGIGGSNGAPTAPTAAAGTNTTQIATTEFVNSAINAIVNNNVVKLNGYSGAYGITPLSLCAFAVWQGGVTYTMESLTTSGGLNGKPPVTSASPTISFPIGCKIYYHPDATPFTSSTAFTSKNFYATYDDVDARYTAVTGSSISLGSQSTSSVYLRVFVDNGYWKPCYKSGETTEIIVTSNNLVSGNFYIYLGKTVGSTGYKFQLEDNNPLYYYDGTNLIDWATYQASEAAPSYTAGDGIDITNNVISCTPRPYKKETFTPASFNVNSVYQKGWQNFVASSNLEVGTYKVTLQVHLYIVSNADNMMPAGCVVNVYMRSKATASSSYQYILGATETFSAGVLPEITFSEAEIEGSVNSGKAVSGNDGHIVDSTNGKMYAVPIPTGLNSVRFLGWDMVSSSNVNNYGWCFGNKVDEEIPDFLDNWNQLKWNKFDHNQSTNFAPKEYTDTVPSGATWLLITLKTAYIPELENPYCYGTSISNGRGIMSKVLNVVGFLEVTGDEDSGSSLEVGFTTNSSLNVMIGNATPLDGSYTGLCSDNDFVLLEKIA